VALIATTAVVLGGTIAACSPGPPVASNAVPPPAAGQDRSVFVAMGGDETLNRGLDDSLRRAWTQQIFGTALGPQAVYVNVATADATVRDGLDVQLPRAVQLRPTLVTIWFGEGDAQIGTTDSSFTRDLTDVITQLRAAGATKVLLLSRTDPAAGNDSHFAAQVRQVATATGADFVEITGLRDPRDPATQQNIANAVTAHLGN
jgi:phosphatidylinositol alpha 1,6-mannosyltransferase